MSEYPRSEEHTFVPPPVGPVDPDHPSVRR